MLGECIWGGRILPPKSYFRSWQYPDYNRGRDILNSCLLFTAQLARKWATGGV